MVEYDGFQKRVKKAVEEFADKNGLQIIESDKFFDGIKKLYHDCSLTQVIEEETPRINYADPDFLERNGIEVPANVEVALFDMYYDKHGEKGMKKVLHSGKVWYRQISYLLNEHPECKEDLEQAVTEFKEVLDGTYLDIYYAELDLAWQEQKQDLQE